MKKTNLKFGVRNNRWNSAPGVCYKTDAETKADKEKKEKETKAAKEKREGEIKSAEKEYTDFEVKGPEDLIKKLELQKAVFEAKGADSLVNFDEKMAVLQEAALEAKNATEENYKKLEEKHNGLQNGFDALQIRIKQDNRVQLTPLGETKSFGEMLTEGIREQKDALANFKKGDNVSFQMKAVADMTFPVNFSTARTSVAYVRPGIIELPKRKLHIRELLTKGGMGAKSTFDFVKEVTGDYLGAPSGSGPASVAEAALKPQFDLKLVEASVKAEWNAGWLRISRNMLDDVEGMSTFLNSRLPELLLRSEDNLLLSGTGVSPQISGITTAGNFTAPTGSATIDVEQLVEAVAQLEGYDREANGILINPRNWYNIWLTKAATSGEYDLPGQMITKIGNSMFIAGIPVFRSTAIATDKFIVGDWSMGANLILREAPRVEFFYEDGINVRENMVTVRVEERIAFPIYGDNYFIYGDFGNS